MSLPTSEDAAREYMRQQREQARQAAIQRLRDMPPITDEGGATVAAPADQLFRNRTVATDQLTHSVSVAADHLLHSATPEPKDSTMADQPDITQFNERVAALRVAHPAMPLAEARRIAHGHASEEGFYAPPVGDGPATSQAVNGEPEPSLVDLLVKDLEQDPRAIEALRWDQLDEEQKALEREAGQRLRNLKAYLADEQERAKAAGVFAPPMESLIEAADAPGIVKEVMRFKWEQEAKAKADAANEPTTADAFAAVNDAFKGALSGGGE